MRILGAGLCLLFLALALSPQTANAEAINRGAGPLIKAEPTPENEDDGLPISDIANKSKLDGELEIHLVSGYETRMGSPYIKVFVDRPGIPVVLILTSYDTVYWVVEPKPGTSIAEVIVNSYYETKVFSPQQVPVYRAKLPYVAEIDTINFQQTLDFTRAVYGRDSISSAYSSYRISRAIHVNQDHSDNPKLAQSYPPVDPSPVSFEFLLMEEQSRVPPGTQRQPAYQTWTPKGPKDGRITKVSPPDTSAWTLDGHYEFTIENDQFFGIDRRTGEKTPYHLPPNFPPFVWSPGLAYIPKLNMVAVAGNSGFYRFDVERREWLDYRELHHPADEIGSLVYDDYMDRLVGFSPMSACQYIELTTDGRPIQSFTVGQFLPGLWRTFDRGNGPCPQLTVIPFQQYVAFIAFHERYRPFAEHLSMPGSVNRIWVWDRTGGKAFLTYKPEPAPARNALHQASMAAPPTAQTVMVKPVLSPEGPLPIAPDDAPKLLNQCSRSAPEAGGDYWVPSEQDLKQLESDLSQYLRSVEFPSYGSEGPTRPYRGQYVGFVRNGTKLIYGSFHSWAGITDISNASDESDASAAKVFIVCDGGTNHWGIVYNPETRGFSEMAVNGL